MSSLENIRRQRHEAICRMWEAGMTQKNIAAAFDVCPSVVRKILIRYFVGEFACERSGMPYVRLLRTAAQMGHRIPAWRDGSGMVGRR